MPAILALSLLLFPASARAKVWTNLELIPVGSTNGAVATGSPVSANTYPVSSSSANYTPGWGSVANIYDGTWPANGTSAAGNTSCVELENGDSPQQMITLDYGSVVQIQHIYASSLAKVTGIGSYSISIAFSANGTDFSWGQSLAMTGGSSGKTVFNSWALSVPIGAQYVRLFSNFEWVNYSTLCQFAVGP